MKIAILNDTHAGVRNSSDVFLKYKEKFYKDVFFPYCDENNVTQILHLGDYYEHRKFVNFKALQHDRKIFLEEMRSRGMTMDIIPGNHDVFYKNTNDLCSLKELLGHFTSNVNIIMHPKVVDYDGCSIGLIPWINAENYHNTMKFVDNCKASIIGGHFEFTGFEMMKGQVNTHGMDTSHFDRFELVMSGHFHTKSQRGNVNYLGTQMEFTWSDCNDPKYFHVFDTETRTLEAIRNPYTIFEKVVYDDTKMDYNSYDVSKLENKFVKVVVVNKTDPFTFDRFIDRIQNTDTHELKIAENFDEFLGENVEDEKVSIEDTTELLDTYVDAVDTDLDKDRLKVLMKGLYVEAQNMEIV
jgi:DNA repair exonuclease SbcCD nuclease subunit